MGRKIPGKKHRTIKDPLKQNQARFDKIKNKINNPPNDIAAQEVPRSLLEVIELKKKTKFGEFDKRKRRKKKPDLLSVEKLLDKDNTLSGMTKSDDYIPNITQKPNESAVSFVRRLNIMTQNLIDEVKFEKKYGVVIKKDCDTGEIIKVQKVKKKRSNSKKMKLSEKRKKKEEEKKNESNCKDFSQLKDKVEFGEVIHKPPDLTSVKKNKKTPSLVEKPKFSSLLLNKVTSQHESVVNTRQKFKLDKEKAEKERRFIVEAYRRAKKKN